MIKYFVIAILCFVPTSLVGAEQPQEVIEVEESSSTSGNVVTTTGTGMAPTTPYRYDRSKYDLSKHWYFGGGVNYNFENFGKELGELSWDDTWGFDVKAGYFFTDYFALECMFQYLNEFKYDNSGRYYYYLRPNYYYYDWDQKITLTGYKFSVNGKVFIPLKSIVRPYGVLGLGYAYGKIKNKVVYHYANGDTIFRASDKEDGMCGRFGAGLDVFITEQFALEGEVSYIMGFGDIDNVRYTSLSLNALVLF